MRKAFTLIELMVVVAVLVTLMTIMFRLSSVASSENAKTETITRLQKLENCLSGYYAAFGSYPPVALHGTRDIYAQVENGVQNDNRNETLSWDQVKAVCESQPVACAFPFSSADGGIRERIEAISAEILARISENYYGRDMGDTARYSFTTCRPGDFTSNWNKREWREVHIFKFGLMSYLLPRYLVMMKGDQEFYSGGGTGCGQWYYNNIDLAMGATDGLELSRSELWQNVQMNGSTGEPERGMQDYIKVANMPTQAVCGRWIPNLAGICQSWQGITLFGVTVSGDVNSMYATAVGNPEALQIYTSDDGGNYYLLDSVTVLDGWNNQFYYYSPLGNQSYVLWSAGANGMTFPPWMAQENLPSADRQTVADWVSDDILRMKQ